MSPSLYGFVREREPVSPEEVASGFLALPELNGDARPRIEEIVGGDPRFAWRDGSLCTVDPLATPLSEASFVIFDLETTGTSSKEGGITEFGAVKVQGGEVVEKFNTLVNPGFEISPFVVRLTGITNEMVAGAPTVSEALPFFEELIEGSVLVAHNAPFDCGFVEAARGGKLNNPVLDTLRLARTLVPGLKRYRLASLALHLGVRQVPNHRALSDAAATAEVFVKLLKMLDNVGVHTVGEATSLKGSKKRVKPQKHHLAKDLPNAPGVYYFLDKDEVVLYVGKSKDLKSRVRTYFNGGDGRRKISRLVTEVAEVRATETRTELQALLLEAREIRRLLPRYNSAGRGERPGWFMKLDAREPYPVPERVPEQEFEEGVVLLGPYKSAGVLDTCVQAMGRIFPIRRCAGKGETCFYGQLGRCAPCNGMSAEEYRTRVVGGISSLLRGEGGEEHLAALVEERTRLAKELEFEAAARLRDLISGIERIRLARTLVSAEGLQAIVAPSTEPDVLEVFVISGGRLVAHESFGTDDREGVSKFASRAVGKERENRAGAKMKAVNEARVVASYLRRRVDFFESASLNDECNLATTFDRAAQRLSESGGQDHHVKLKPAK